jgi:prepilin-type N-terminal cleavage/methylation domain-containing protein
MKSNRGFTLMEILVVIGIIAILGAAAVPNIVGWRTKQRFTAAASDVHEAVRTARSWAIKNNATVGILFDVAQRRFTVFADADDDGSPDPGELIILSGSFQNDIVLNTSFTGHRLSFNGRGLTDAVGDGITLTNAVHGTRVVQVTVTGNSRILY